jgi:hypothetical protein
MICDQELRSEKSQNRFASYGVKTSYLRYTEDLLGEDGCETIFEVSVTVEGERVT